MDAFERYGRDLVRARPRMVRRTVVPNRPKPIMIAAAAALVVVAVVALVYTMPPAGSDIEAEALALVSQVRKSLALARPCRIVRGTADDVVLQGVAPLPSTRITLSALRRPQTVDERNGIGYVANKPTKKLASRIILGDSLRITRGEGDLSALVVVTRSIQGGEYWRVDPIGCLQRQWMALQELNRAAAGLALRGQRMLLLGTRTPSPAALMRAEAVVLDELARLRRRVPMDNDGIFVVFRKHGWAIGTAAANAESFAREGMLIAHSVPLRSSHGRLIVGLVPDGVCSVELRLRDSDALVIGRVVHNLFVAHVPAHAAWRAVLVWRRHGGVSVVPARVESP